MLKTLMGDHDVTRQFKTHTDKFDFVEVKGSAAQYFKRVVRDLEFDVAEMAIITYLIGKAHGKPYRLLSDAEMRLTATLRRPTFRADGASTLKRLTLIVDQQRVTRQVLYPIGDAAGAGFDALAAIDALACATTRVPGITTRPSW